MNKFHKQRIYYLLLLILGLTLASGLILYALRQNINVFLTPKQLSTQKLPTNYHFRLGGLVKQGSLIHDRKNLTVQFTVTDLKKEITVRFDGILPDLFREGKGMIAEGYLNSDNVFIANNVLAKHDENYIPKNMYQALREQKT